MAHHRKFVSETHREREERLDALASIELAPPAQQMVWNLQDDLVRIDAAEKLLARGYVAVSDYGALAVLAGRSVEVARAETQRRYREAVLIAGASARMAA